MKILQLNIWSGRLEKQITELLDREKADVLCLQEVISVPGGNSFFFLDMEEAQKILGYEYSYLSPSNSFNYMKRKASWGNCILSKISFEYKEQVYTFTGPNDDFDFLENDKYNSGRVLQHVSIKTNEGLLHVLNHHGHHKHEHKNGDEETRRQCNLIADYVKDLEGPVVLCGDFNLVPDSPSIEQINHVLVNHVKERGIVTTRTPLTHKTEACDYIFTSSDIEVKTFQVLDDIVSDHKALTIEF